VKIDIFFVKKDFLRIFVEFGKGKREGRSWKLEAGRGKLEAGRGKMEAGRVKMEGGRWKGEAYKAIKKSVPGKPPDLLNPINKYFSS
jgi:hypothetical protein